MNIKTLLKIVIFFIVLVSITFSYLIYTNLNSYKKTVKNEFIAVDLTYQIFQRRLLGDDYLLHPGERSKSQWFLKQDQLKETVSLNKGNFTADKEKELVTKISNDIGESEGIFRQIIEVSENPTISTTSAEQQKNILSSQLTLKAQETISNANNLGEINREKTDKVLQDIIFLFSVVASLFFLILLASFLVIWRSANQLDNSKAQAEAVLNGLGDGLIVIDKEGKVIVINKIAADLLGFSNTELIGQEFTSITQMEDANGLPIPPAERPFAKALTSGQVIKQDTLYYRRKDGTKLLSLITVSPVKIADQIIGAVEIVKDISERKKYEDQLKTRTDEAERLNKITVDRELKMIELKQEIARLQGKPVEEK